jgi:hypothetical protein
VVCPTKNPPLDVEALELRDAAAGLLAIERKAAI